VDALLVRNSLKMFTAVFITAAIALWFERIEFVWYPLMAVVIVVDDNDDHTVKAQLTWRTATPATAPAATAP